MKAAYWLATHGLFSLLFYMVHVHLRRGGPAHSYLGPPTVSIINQENALHTVLPTGQSFGDIFSITIPSSQMTLACVKLI